MVRKPEPKDAASRICTYLADQGFGITQRQALDVVAIVEGYRTWQAMDGILKKAAKKSGASTKPQKRDPHPLPPGPPVPEEHFRRCWQDLHPDIEEFVDRFGFDFGAFCRPEYQVTTGRRLSEYPEGRHEPYRYSFRLEPKAGRTRALIQFYLGPVEREDRPGELSLRLTAETEDQGTIGIWTSEPSWAPGQSMQELKDWLDGFTAEPVVQAVKRSKAAQYLRDDYQAPNGYDSVWQEVLHPAHAAMKQLREQLSNALRRGYSISQVSEDYDDDFQLSMLVTSRSSEEMPLLAAELRLVESEDEAGDYALRFALVHVPEQRELVTWTSGQRYSSDLWSTTAQELIERLAGFAVEEVIYAIASSDAREYLKASSTV